MIITVASFVIGLAMLIAIYIALNEVFSEKITTRELFENGESSVEKVPFNTYRSVEG